MENHRPIVTHKSSLPQPCLGPQAGPISVVRPPHIVQSTCKLQNKVKWQLGINDLQQLKSKIDLTIKKLSKKNYTYDPT